MEYATLFELTLPFERRVAGVAPGDVKAAFAALTEEAFPLLSARKMEFDDVLLEHIGEFVEPADADAAPLAVVLPTLSHPQDWMRALNVARRAAGLGPTQPEQARFQRLILRVIRELNPPVPDFRIPKGY